jgi:DNA-binding LacI/PurR family transcriptional regulator
MALGASKALHQAGLRIPQDISLFGFDDAPSAKWLEPGLSTVYLPIDNMITTAIDQAIRLAIKNRSKRSRRLPAPWCCVIPSPPGHFSGN